MPPTISDITKRHTTWLFVAPIAKLLLTRDVNSEFRVEHVTFVAASRLPNRRKRFGIPDTISDLREQKHGIFERFFTQGDTLATLRRTGVGNTCEKEFLRLVQNELAILASSQLCYGSRRQSACPTIFYGQKPKVLSYLLFDILGRAWVQPNRAIPPFVDLVLDGAWQRFQKDAFFFGLLRVVRGEVKSQRAWRDILRRSAILIGQSQSSSDVVQSFLWNMIALELLVLKESEKAKQHLVERASALLDASSSWQRQNYPRRIEELCRKRNLLVHQGKADIISGIDLKFLDGLLFNLLINIVRHPTLLPTKQALVEFCEDVKAAKRIHGRHRVRPRTMVIHR